jgi:hypothetical protein
MTDLIKRLRENPNYRHWLIMAEAADEIERLRDALAEIDEYHNAGGTQVITCARIAREALRSESENKPLPVGPHDRSWCG